uniref:Trichohyalin-plectin-homology domain-containing protein n=1 Tax=Spongospora subterranea TaxID=70186 RepID=A0A0H5QSB3_9EUKA|eukprot:CRZ04913.1 hypothetical protein [Spongospora subterranea]
MQAPSSISKSSLDRIRQAVSPTSSSGHDIRREKLRALQAKSIGRVQTWSNTLEAQREQAIVARAKRLELEEQKQQVQDEEDRLRYEAKRQQIINNAKRIMFEETEMMKKLSSAKLLSDVVVERKACRKVKDAIAQKALEAEELFQEGMRTQREIGIREEMQQATRRRSAQMQSATMVRQQKLDAENARVQSKLEARAEGERLQAKAKRDREEDTENSRLKAIAQKQAKAQALEAQKRHLEVIRLAKEKDAKELAASVVAAEKRQQLADLLKSKHAERARQKFEQRERINMAVAKAREQQLLAQVESTEREAEERNLKQRKEESQVAQKHASRLEDMKRSIAAQIECRRKNQEEVRAQNEKDLANANDEVAAHYRDESCKIQSARQKSLELAAFHQQQMNSKREQAIAEDPEQQNVDAVVANRNWADERFHQYSDELMRKYSALGPDVALPIRLTMNRIYAEQHPPKRKQQRSTNPF